MSTDLHPHRYIVPLLSFVPSTLANAAQLLGGNISGGRAENVIFLASTLLVAAIFLRKMTHNQLYAIVFLVMLVVCGILSGNDLAFAIADGAIVVQFLLNYLIFYNVYSTDQLPLFRQSLLLNSILVTVSTGIFSLFLPIQSLSVDHFSVILAPLLFVGRSKFLVFILYLILARTLYGVIGTIFLGLLLGIAHAAMFPSLRVVAKYSFPRVLVLVAVAVGMATLFWLGLDRLQELSGLVTNRQSAEIRFLEFRGLLARPDWQQVFGSGFGYANDISSFYEFDEFDDTGRLRVFHFSFSWMFAKLGLVGIAILLLVNLRLIMAFISAQTIREATRVYFYSSLIIVAVIGMNTTFGFTLKNYLLAFTLCAVNHLVREDHGISLPDKRTWPKVRRRTAGV